jgi:ABC-type multidrug transport system ATPase subunit
MFPLIIDVMDPDIVLQATDLGKRFGKRWAVSGLHLTIRRGEVFGFLGPNGAGKSTTIRMLLTLVKPTTGSVALFGKQLVSARHEILSRVGGMVERSDFYLYLSARRNLRIVGALRGGTTLKEIDRVLDVVGLLDRGDDRVKTFSHGMKQRLAIAQALLGQPEFIVLDEPTSGLDPQGIKEVRDLIRRLSADRAMTIFLSSHLLHEIEQTASSMAIINRGKLVVEGAVHDLLERGEQRLRVIASSIADAQAIMSRFDALTNIRVEGEAIECTMSRDVAAELNRTMVQAGIAVRMLAPRRSLEEYFLSITEGASEVSARAPAQTGGNH